MKRFKTDFQGLLPIYLDDIRFVDSSHKEIYNALMHAIAQHTSADSFILSGCEISGTLNNGMLGSGYVVLDGDIYRVPNQILPDYDPDINLQYEWVIVETTLSGGTKQPKRTSTPVETWVEDIAQLQPSDVGILYNDCPRIAFDLFDRTWSHVQLVSGVDPLPGVGLSFKRNGNLVELRGAVTVTVSGLTTLTQLPTNIRPSRKIFCPTTIKRQSGDLESNLLTLNTDGILTYQNSGIGIDDIVYIQLQYFLT